MQRLSIENNIKNLEKVAGFVEQFCAEQNLERKICFELNLVLDELVTNTIHYAYSDEDVHWIEITLDKIPGKITIQITDDGNEFNPMEKEEVNTNTTLEEKSIGGLGIHFVKQKVDELSYSRKDGKNILSLIKKLK